MLVSAHKLNCTFYVRDKRNGRGDHIFLLLDIIPLCRDKDISVSAYFPRL